MSERTQTRLSVRDCEATIRDWSGFAWAISRDFGHSSLEPQDWHQEAMIALWQATSSYDPSRGVPFSSFAGMLIRRRLSTILRLANSQKRHAQNDALRGDHTDDNGTLATIIELVPAADSDPVDILTRRDEVRQVVAEINQLSPLERRAIVELLNGVPQNKQTDNAVYRARNKLREAMAA